MRVWIFQDSRQKKILNDKAPWSIGWYFQGKRHSQKIGSRSMADKARRKKEGELAAGLVEVERRDTWEEFAREWEVQMGDVVGREARKQTLQVFDKFKRLVKPREMKHVATTSIDAYIARRSKERGKKKGSKVSPATINKELRHLKAALRIAEEWGMLKTVPRFRMLREPEKLPRYVTPEHFALIYGACDAATIPAVPGYSPGDWWRALLVFCYMTGWRISEPLSVLRRDVDLESGIAITRHKNNKGKRDEAVPLHAVVVDHLRKIPGFDKHLFPWSASEWSLWNQYRLIQETAGINLECNEDHEHTDKCPYYGFHDLRRAFATLNAANMSADALQTLMRHKSYTTTQRYIAIARQVNPAVSGLHVPEVLQAKAE